MPPKAYRNDLAYIHDAGFGFVADSAGPLLVKELRKVGHTHGTVIELGCGSGILSTHVANAGYDVVGIDQSRAMIELAKRRVPSGRFRVESVFDAKLPNCVGVAAVGEIVNYLFDDSNSDQRLRELVQRVHTALRPGGLFLFDIAEPGRVPGGGPISSYRLGDDWAVLFTSSEDGQNSMVTRDITTFRRVGKLYRRDREFHQLRLLRRQDVLNMLRHLGFRVRILPGYGEQRYPGWVGFLAKK
jgi:SAM-dependent methyltransferase